MKELLQEYINNYSMLGDMMSDDAQEKQAIISFLRKEAKQFGSQHYCLLKDMERETLSSRFYAGGQFALSWAANKIAEGIHLRQEDEEGKGEEGQGT